MHHRKRKANAALLTFHLTLKLEQKSTGPPSRPPSPSPRSPQSFKIYPDPHASTSASQPSSSLVTLSLDGEGKVKYHKYMWNEKDHSHEVLGKVFKTLNGDHLTKITQPPGTL